MILPVLLLFVGCCARGRDPEQLALNWDELGPGVANQKVAFAMKDGTHVEGTALAVETGGLRMKVRKTSNSAAQPKGKHLVPRDSLSVVQVTRYRKMGRLVGTLGAAALAGGIAAASYPDIYEGTVLVVVPAVVAGGIAGATVAGYYIGKAFDKRVVEIRIVPDAGR